jgi:hypothetical protein
VWLYKGDLLIQVWLYKGDLLIQVWLYKDDLLIQVWLYKGDLLIQVWMYYVYRQFWYSTNLYQGQNKIDFESMNLYCVFPNLNCNMLTQNTKINSFIYIQQQKIHD